MALYALGMLLTGKKTVRFQPPTHNSNILVVKIEAMQGP